MRILITGSAGRVGRAIYIKLMNIHDVVGVDTTPCSTVDFVADIRNINVINKALQGVDAVVHTAALHAPHVGLFGEHEFQSINVEATERLALQAIKNGIKHFIFTSTTALYGHASTPNGMAGWITEQVEPQPKSVYHRSKILAEHKLHEISQQYSLPVTVLQMSRCFPEAGDLMAVYRLTRGVDARDVANAHLCAVTKRLDGFNRFIISAATPFHRSDQESLFSEADVVIRRKCHKLAQEFELRGWELPKRLDRIYDSSAAQEALGWRPKYGFESVLDMLDKELAEVLPVIERKADLVS